MEPTLPPRPTPPATPTPDIAPPPPPAPDVPVNSPPPTVSDSIGADEGITPVNETTDSLPNSPQAMPQPPADQPAITGQQTGGPKPKKQGLPMAAVIVAVVVFVALVVAAVMLYMNSNKKTTPPQSTTTTTPATTTGASATDVNDTVSGIDKSIKTIDDNKDFSSSDLSSTSLSL